MRKALVESRNIPAVRTLDAVGINRATDFLGNLGMTFNDKLTLQNGIGLYISTEQEAAYAAFANGGTYYKPHLLNHVVTADGKTHNYGVKGKRAMSPATAFMITDMLKGVMTSSNGSVPRLISPDSIKRVRLGQLPILMITHHKFLVTRPWIRGLLDTLKLLAFHFDRV